jgi:uncharacterized protein
MAADDFSIIQKNWVRSHLLMGTLTKPAQQASNMGMNRLLAALFLLTLAIAQPSPAAADMNEGIAAYKRGDYAAALIELRPLAEQGNSDAQFYLGIMYYNGQGVPQDYSEAVKWYRKAAGQGIAIAQNNLGFMYDEGRGVPQDYAEAVKWYRKAAEQGDASAQLNLGVKYQHGQGVPQDYVQSHMWSNLAASQLGANEFPALKVLYPRYQTSSPPPTNINIRDSQSQDA